MPQVFWAWHPNPFRRIHPFRSPTFWRSEKTSHSGSILAWQLRAGFVGKPCFLNKESLIRWEFLRRNQYEYGTNSVSPKRSMWFFYIGIGRSALKLTCFALQLFDFKVASIFMWSIGASQHPRCVFPKKKERKDRKVSDFVHCSNGREIRLSIFGGLRNAMEIPIYYRCCTIFDGYFSLPQKDLDQNDYEQSGGLQITVTIIYIRIYIYLSIYVSWHLWCTNDSFVRNPKIRFPFNGLYMEIWVLASWTHHLYCC